MRSHARRLVTEAAGSSACRASCRCLRDHMRATARGAAAGWAPPRPKVPQVDSHAFLHDGEEVPWPSSRGLARAEIIASDGLGVRQLARAPFDPSAAGWNGRGRAATRAPGRRSRPPSPSRGAATRDQCSKDDDATTRVENVEYKSRFRHCNEFRA